MRSFGFARRAAAALADNPGARTRPEPVAEDASKPCNICGRGWPYHEEVCAYAANVRELERVKKRLAEAEADYEAEMFTRLAAEAKLGRCRIECSSSRVCEHGTRSCVVEHTWPKSLSEHPGAHAAAANPARANPEKQHPGNR